LYPGSALHRNVFIVGEADTNGELSVDIHPTLETIDAGAWNALVSRDDPFMEYEFLAALERSGSVGAETSWQPRYLTLSRGGHLLGAVAAYLKWDSYGEYIFDWQWADAYQRAGLDYYPKLVVGVPFTPVSGTRVLVAEGEDFEACADALISGVIELAKAESLSGVHFLFVSEPESKFLVSRGFLPRVTHQFHWENRGYQCFEDFTADLRSAKRKQVRKERRAVAELGLDISVVEGDQVKGEHLDALWRFYANTTERKWGEAYLTRECFALLAERFRHRLVLITVCDGRRLVAGALGARKGAQLYGRYWGALGDYPGLHFECCYYRFIDYAITNGLTRFEAGAQGEHKFLRGFAARPTLSAHWLADAGGRRAVDGYLRHEREHSLATIAQYNRLSPLKHLRRGD